LYFLTEPLLLRVRQVKDMLKFTHPNLVRAFEAFHAKGVNFIEMERAL